MNNNLDFIESLQEELINEKIFYGLNSLNNYIEFNDENILLVNIRSLNANFCNLNVFIERLEVKPCIIVCTETRVLAHYNEFSIKGYKIFYNNSNINITDGVVMYIKDSIEEETNTVKIGRLSILKSIIVLDNKRNLTISALYRAHDLSKLDFIHDLKIYLENSLSAKDHIIVGDFNIDLIKLDILGQEHLNNLLEKGFKPGFCTITRPSTNNVNTGSCIDNFFIKTNSIETKSFKYEDLFNDHYPLFLSINKINTTPATSFFTPINYYKLHKTAADQNWHEILSMQDPNEATDFLISLIHKCMDSAKFDYKKSKHKTNMKPRSKWITEGIIISCNTKEMLYKAWKLNPTSNILKTEYIKYSKTLDKVIKLAKQLYDRDTVKQNCDNTRKLWNVVNNMMGKGKNMNNDITYIVNEYNEKTYDSITISKLMNDYFCSIGTKLSEKIVKPPNILLALPTFNPKTIFISPTDSNEISEIISKMKLKNGGVDKINMKIIKNLSEYIVNPLVHIINLSIDKSIWPDALKCADIKPIFKSKNKHVISNYRPISLISNLAKIFEKVLYFRLLNFIKKSKILSNKQFGFLKNLGTRDALNYLSNIIYKKLDKSIPIVVTFLDLAKAFDTVNHKILLDKLYNYGIRGKAYSLISSYLCGRKQRVKINGIMSDFGEVRTGVPQGTILGPLFFILYINDLLINLPEDIIISYADDTAVISTDKNWQLVASNMNNYLKIISEWLALNELSLNIDKTVFMTFGNYCDSVPLHMNLNIDGHNINRVGTCKYLGIIFDYRMRWENHIQHIVNKTKYLIFLFYKFSKFMLTETLLMIYYAFFHSIINYGIVAWGGCLPSHKLMLNKLQSKLLKIIFNNRFETDRKPLNIDQLFALESLWYHYNELKNKYSNSNSVTRRGSVLLPLIFKTIGSRDSYIKAIHLFNNLPNELKTLSCSKYCKTKLKKWIISDKLS